MKSPAKNDHNPKEDLKDVYPINFPAFITPMNEDNETEGGILLPNLSDEDEEEEKVVEVAKESPRCKYIKEGDKVLLRDGTKPIATLTRNSNVYFLFEEISIVAVIGREVKEFDQFENKN